MISCEIVFTWVECNALALERLFWYRFLVVGGIVVGLLWCCCNLLEFCWCEKIILVLEFRSNEVSFCVLTFVLEPVVVFV